MALRATPGPGLGMSRSPITKPQPVMADAEIATTVAFGAARRRTACRAGARGPNAALMLGGLVVKGAAGRRKALA